jgi:hypothetical protein
MYSASRVSIPSKIGPNSIAWASIGGSILAKRLRIPLPHAFARFFHQMSYGNWLPVSESPSAALFTFSEAERYPEVNTPTGGNWRVLAISQAFSRHIKIDRR